MAKKIRLAVQLGRKEEMLSVAPMIDWTDKNYRYLIRQLTKQTTLYTDGDGQCSPL
jgi:tRNA-dihydrouridine synthase